MIWLGDRVIASKDPELIRIYEEASETYQAVSEAVEGADAAEAVDDLDDRIDHAEWQFETIEARLDGRPDPPPPRARRPGRATITRRTILRTAGTGGRSPRPGRRPPVRT